MAEFVGSSGTLVGAALETLGYYYQSWILDALGEPGISSIGALLYIVGAVIAIVTFVVAGNFRLGAWFFLGPGLFFSMILPRQETSGSDWQFGGEPRDRQKLDEAVGSFYYQNPYVPRISSFFAAYNDLVSSSVREIVGALNGQRERVDLKFTFRSQLYSYLISPTAQDPGFRELMHLALLGKCQQLIEAGQEMDDRRNAQPIREEWARKYSELRGKRLLVMSDYPMAVRYLAGLKVDYPQVFQNMYVTDPDQEIQNFYSGCHDNPAQGCITPPTDIGQGIQNIEQQQVQWRSTYGNQPYYPDANGNGGVNAALDQRAAAMDQAKKEIEQQAFTCHQVWNYVFVGLHEFAYRTMQQANRIGQERGLTADDLRKMFTEMFATNDEQQIYRSIAKRLMSNEASLRSTASIIGDYVQKGRRINELSVTPESSLTATERNRTGNRVWQERTKVYASAASLPYYQGLGLYFLALSYPFFAFLLLVPGKHAGFILWMVLWLWMKSWDIGFAAVMLLDDVLYSLFVGDLQAGADPKLHKLDSDLSVAILSLRESDPTFHLATYYSIVAIALHSIPMISSYLILGGMTGGAGLIAAGRSRWSGMDGGSIGSGGGLAQAAKMGQSQFGVDAARAEALGKNLQRAARYANQAQNSSGGVGIDGQSENAGMNAARSGLTNEAIGHRKSNTLGMTGEGMTSTATTVAFGAGLASGLQTSPIGRINPLNQFGRREKFNRVRDAVAKNLAAVGDEVTSSLLNLASDRYEISAAWAMYDGMNSAEVQHLASLGRNYDMFEIPWTEQNGGWDAEFKQYLDEWGAAVRIASKSMTAVAEIGDALLTSQKKGGRELKNLAREWRAEGLSKADAKTAAYIEALGKKLAGQLGGSSDELLVAGGITALAATGDKIGDGVRWVGKNLLGSDGSAPNNSGAIFGHPQQGGAPYAHGGPITYTAGGPTVRPGAPDVAMGSPNTAYGQPNTAYAYPGSPGTIVPQVAYGTPQYGRGGDPSYGRGIERLYPHAVDALNDYESRLMDKSATGKMSGGRDTNTRLSYGDPSVAATEAHLDAAHERLEQRVKELRAKGVTGPELEEAERLLNGFHSSEAAYDSMHAMVDSRVESSVARSSDHGKGEKF